MAKKRRNCFEVLGEEGELWLFMNKNAASKNNVQA